jgi:hypothetical protein
LSCLVVVCLVVVCLLVVVVGGGGGAREWGKKATATAIASHGGCGT